MWLFGVLGFVLPSLLAIAVLGFFLLGLLAFGTALSWRIVEAVVSRWS